VLSSHDLDEVQRLAARAVVIAHGRLAAIEDVRTLSTRASRLVEVGFGAPVDIAPYLRIPGVSGATLEAGVLRCVVVGPPGRLLAVLAEAPVASITIEPPGLEEVFFHDAEEDRHVSA